MGSDTEGPSVDGVGVAAFDENFGVIHVMLPATPVSGRRSEKWLAMLKSVRWACPRASRKILSGLRSLSKKMKMETYSPTLNAPVHDKILMEIGKCRHDLGYEESYSRLWERSCGSNFVSKITVYTNKTHTTDHLQASNSGKRNNFSSSLKAYRRLIMNGDQSKVIMSAKT